MDKKQPNKATATLSPLSDSNNNDRQKEIKRICSKKMKEFRSGMAQHHETIEWLKKNYAREQEEGDRLIDKILLPFFAQETERFIATTIAAIEKELGTMSEPDKKLFISGARDALPDLAAKLKKTFEDRSSG